MRHPQHLLTGVIVTTEQSHPKPAGRDIISTLRSNMKVNVAAIRSELNELVDEGIALLLSFSPDQLARANKEREKPFRKVDFKVGYQDWYTKALATTETLLPNRVGDFRSLYQMERRKGVDVETYGIADYLVGLSLVQHKSVELVSAKFTQQLQILQSCFAKLDSALLNLRQLVHADFLDSELDEARTLAKSGFLRAAGALAGVALEKHLGLILSIRKIPLRKKEPTIAELNDALKTSDVYDVPTWRFVSRLADIRNLCDHNKQREPSKDEVTELVDGVEKIAKSVA